MIWSVNDQKDKDKRMTDNDWYGDKYEGPKYESGEKEDEHDRHMNFSTYLGRIGGNWDHQIQ